MVHFETCRRILQTPEERKNQLYRKEVSERRFGVQKSSRTLFRRLPNQLKHCWQVNPSVAKEIVHAAEFIAPEMKLSPSRIYDYQLLRDSFYRTSIKAIVCRWQQWWTNIKSNSRQIPNLVQKWIEILILKKSNISKFSEKVLELFGSSFKSQIATLLKPTYKIT